MTEPEPPRPTTASIDRRVERLENSTSAMAIDLQLLKSEQTHLRELMMSRFSAIEVGQTAQSAKLDNILLRLESVMSDPANSPAGRALALDISELQKDVDDVTDVADRVDRKLMIATGAIIVGMSLINLYLPLIRGVFNIPD